MADKKNTGSDFGATGLRGSLFAEGFEAEAHQAVDNFVAPSGASRFFQERNVTAAEIDGAIARLGESPVSQPTAAPVSAAKGPAKP
jgi:hypothetical protein